MSICDIYKSVRFFIGLARDAARGAYIIFDDPATPTTALALCRQSSKDLGHRRKGVFAEQAHPHSVDRHPSFRGLERNGDAAAMWNGDPKLGRHHMLLEPRGTGPAARCLGEKNMSSRILDARGQNKSQPEQM